MQCEILSWLLGHKKDIGTDISIGGKTGDIQLQSLMALGLPLWLCKILTEENGGRYRELLSLLIMHLFFKLNLTWSNRFIFIKVKYHRWAQSCLRHTWLEPQQKLSLVFSETEGICQQQTVENKSDTLSSQFFHSLVFYLRSQRIFEGENKSFSIWQVITQMCFKGVERYGIQHNHFDCIC